MRGGIRARTGIGACRLQHAAVRRGDGSPQRAGAAGASDRRRSIPAFTTTPYGITYVEPEPNLWGARAELAKVQRVRYDYPGLSVGRKVCVESGALPATVTDKRFGTRVFIGEYLDRKGSRSRRSISTACSRSYRSCSTRASTRRVRAQNPDHPVARGSISAVATGSTLPTKSDAIAADGHRVPRARRSSATSPRTRTWISDPLGKAPIGLGKPTSTTPFGIRGHVLSDSVNGRTAGDIAGRIELPTATRRLPATDVDVQRQHAAEPDRDVSVVADVLPRPEDAVPHEAARDHRRVRRRRRPRAPARAPRPQRSGRTGRARRVHPHRPGVANRCATSTSPGRIDHVPGMVELVAHMNANRRVPSVDMGLHVDTLVNPTAFPNLEHVQITVLDDAHPAFVGAGSDHDPRVLNYDVNLTSRRPRDRGRSRVPGQRVVAFAQQRVPEPQLCRSRPDGRRLRARAGRCRQRDRSRRTRPDRRRRSLPDGIAARTSRSTERSTPRRRTSASVTRTRSSTVFDTSDIDLCIDVDLPFQIDLQNTTTARLGIDLATWVLEVPPNSSEKMTLEFGERLPSGTWLPGGRWFEHYAHFNPEGSGQLAVLTGRPPQRDDHARGLLGRGRDHELLRRRVGAREQDLDRQEVQQRRRADLLRDRRQDVLHDRPVLEPDIRNDMYCRDRPACHPDFAGRPGSTSSRRSGTAATCRRPARCRWATSRTSRTRRRRRASALTSASGTSSTRSTSRRRSTTSTRPTCPAGTDGSRTGCSWARTRAHPGFVVTLGAEYDNGIAALAAAGDAVHAVACLIGGLELQTHRDVAAIAVGAAAAELEADDHERFVHGHGDGARCRRPEWIRRPAVDAVAAAERDRRPADDLRAPDGADPGSTSTSEEGRLPR